MNLHPFDLSEAREAARMASSQQQASEQAVRDASKNLAEAERQYRMALAQKIVTLHAEGTAWTACQDVAKGDEKVARLRYDRDVKAGVLEAAQQAAWRHTADRKDLGRFIDWSQRRELAENGGPDDRLGLRPAA